MSSASRRIVVHARRGDQEAIRIAADTHAEVAGSAAVQADGAIRRALAINL
jgi:hypothetical protein